jgi:hypothetical protein
MLNMFRPRWPQKTYAYFRRTVQAGSNISRGRSGTLGVVSTSSGTWPSLRRRSEEAPRPAAPKPQPAIPRRSQPGSRLWRLGFGIGPAREWSGQTPTTTAAPPRPGKPSAPASRKPLFEPTSPLSTPPLPSASAHRRAAKGSKTKPERL